MTHAPPHADDWLRALPSAPSGEQHDRLLRFLQQLARWNKVYNLTAVRDTTDMLTVHLADCLATVPSIAERQPARLLDVGAGGGLPGMVLGIMLPDTRVVLNDTVQKKCAFLQQTVATLRLPNVEVIHARVESLETAPFDCITSRAFSDLSTFVRLTRHLLAPGGAWAAMKGRVPDDEIVALPPDIDASVDALHVPGLDARRCLVWMHAKPSDPIRVDATHTHGTAGSASRRASSQSDLIGDT